MKISGIDGMSPQQIGEALDNGAKFVVYQYCISIILVTCRRSTDIYFIQPGQNGVGKGLPWTLLTFLLGLWEIPWGPIYSIRALGMNLSGGKDITEKIRTSIDIHELPH